LTKNNDILIKNAFRHTFDEIERSLFEMANRKIISEKSGACALAVFIHENKCYAANAGDSHGIICGRDKSDKMGFYSINSKMNANCKVEQERLRKKFPNDSDIITSKVFNKAKSY
jgi:serine/threonine protein phosphatase PrpC